MAQTTPTTHGGARPGSGPKNLKPATRTLSFRILEDTAEKLAAAGIDNPAQFYKEAGEKAAKRLQKKSPA